MTIWTIQYKLSGLEREPYTIRLQGPKSRVDALIALQRQVGRVVGIPTMQKKIYRPEAI